MSYPDIVVNKKRVSMGRESIYTKMLIIWDATFPQKLNQSYKLLKSESGEMGATCDYCPGNTRAPGFEQ